MFFLFFKNHFWHQHIKAIQNIQTILNFSKKKKISKFLGTQPQPRSLSWPSIVTPMSWVAGLVKVIQVDSFFFFLIIFMILIIIFLIFSFHIKLFALGFVIFSLFFLLHYFKSGLIKLTWSACIFVHNIFFYLAWAFFAWSFFWKSIFLSRSHVACDGLVELTGFT